MTGNLLAAACCGLLLLPVASSAQGARKAGRTASETAASRESDSDNPRERYQWFRKGRTLKGESVASRLARAYEQKRRMRNARRSGTTAAAQVSTSANTSTSAGAATAAAVVAGSWVPLGPKPVDTDATRLGQQDYGPAVGRVTSVVVDQRDPNGSTVLVGGAYGGVWRATNANAVDPNSIVWTPLFDQQPTLAIGSIALKPDNSNVILAGTGETNNSGDAYYGLGLFRSADGGATWNSIVTANNGTLPLRGLGFSKIAWSTDNTNIVVTAASAATMGIITEAELPNTTRGLYYSLDAGVSWRLAAVREADGTTVTGAASTSSVVFNPFDRKFYAALRYHGFYVSSDGQTFTRLAQQPGGNLIDPAVCLPQFDPSISVNCPMYRGEIAVREDTGEIYAWFVDFNETNHGIYRSSDSGGTWTAMDVSGINACGDSTGCGTEQGFYNLALMAVPNGASTDLYAGAINIFKCTVTAANPTCSGAWKNLTRVYGCNPIGSLSGVHPDQHAFDFSRTNPKLLYFGHDGGVSRALDGAQLTRTTCGGIRNPFDNISGTMGSMLQFVWLSQNPTDDRILLGGTQDNGSPATAQAGTSQAWASVNLGDGGYNDISPAQPNTWFTANTRVSIQRCSNGTACRAQDFSNVVISATLGGDDGAFYTPYMLDPQDATKLLVGTCRVWRGNAGGSGFTALSTNLHGGAVPCSKDSSVMVMALAAGGPSTTAGSQVIYATTEGDGSPTNPGRVYVTSNAGAGAATWVNRTSTINQGNFPISAIAMDPADDSGMTAYAGIMGFGVRHVWKTTNGGAAWSDVGGNLPDAPVNALLVDPDNRQVVYAGTDIGVFVTGDGGASWAELGPATGAGMLPNVAVTRLLMFRNSAVKKLRAATYGRGIWEVAVDTGTPPTTPDFALVANTTSVTVARGGTATYTLSVTPQNGFNGTVTFACSGLPAAATCAFTPANPTVSGTATNVSLSIRTTAATTASLRNGSSSAWWMAVPLLGMVLAGGTRRSRRALTAGALFAVLAIAGCGGGGSTTTPRPRQTSGTPAGTYAVTVTASSGALQHTANLTLIVQ